jgi:hypothetical protein
LFASQFAVKVSTSVFATNTIYCTLIEHPTRQTLDNRAYHGHWKAGFMKVAVCQSALSLIGCTGALVSIYYAPDSKMIAVAALLGSILPYTMAFMMKTNHALLDPKCDPESPKTRALLDY